MSPFTIFSEVLSDRELRDLFEIRTGPLHTSVSIEDIVCGHSSPMFVKHRTPRGHGRVDIALTPSWARLARRTVPPFAKVAGIVEEMAAKSSSAKTRIQWHLMVVSSGAAAQEWHQDAPGNKVYITFLLPLTHDVPGSGTEFETKTKGKASTIIFNSFGSACAFDGRTVHRGTSHTGTQDRVFLYAAVFTGSDPNV